MQRLSDASKSGVYRVSRTDEILDATEGSALQVSRIPLTGAADKQALMQRIASELHFPSWFGANWDALEDCLADLSWSAAHGHVLLFEGTASLAEDERGILLDVLAAAAASWMERGRPFFAVFLDGPAGLADLYRSRK